LGRTAFEMSPWWCYRVNYSRILQGYATYVLPAELYVTAIKMESSDQHIF